MRRWPILSVLFLSIAANVALWLKVNHAPPWVEMEFTTNSPASVLVTNRHVLSVQQPSSRVTWQDLDDPSIPNFVANLRAVKCPELTIRDIVTARLDEQLDARIAAIPGVTEFWSTAIQKDRLQAEQREKVRALERDEEAMVRELFGSDWNRDAYLDWVVDPNEEFFLGFLPREKAMAVEFDLNKLAEASHIAFAGNGRDIAPRGDAEELARLSRHLKSLLTPAEYAELNLRSLVSPVIIWGLPDVPMSGVDVRYIVTLYSRHLDFLDSYLKSPDTFHGLKKSTEAAVQEDIRNYLGAERYAAFQRAQDFQYVYLHKLAHDAGLSSDTAEKIFAMKPEASREALAIFQNASLAADARAQQLADLRNKYRGPVLKLLGEDKMKDYEYRANAWWNKLGEVTNSGGAK
jgi:hypothetical protein